MAKYCVKKPFTALVAVIMVLVLGVVSFTGMTTDLLPALELPYVMVMTTYPGASPEKVEASVTTPLESSLGTVNGVVSVTSNSSENMSTISLQFEDGTNMDSAMVKLSTAIDQVKSYLPDTAQNPMLMQISPDMMPVIMASIHMDDADLFKLTDFAEQTVIPALERQPGVASVNSAGLVKQSIEVRLDEEKIDEVNTRILASVDNQLADARAELQQAEKAVSDGKAQLASGKDALKSEQDKTINSLSNASAKLDSAVAAAQSITGQKTTLEVNKTALTTEKEGLKKGLEQLESGLEQLNQGIAGLTDAKNGLDLLIGTAELAGVDPEIPLVDIVTGSGLPEEVISAIRSGLDQLVSAGLIAQNASLNDAKAARDKTAAQLEELTRQQEPLAQKQQELSLRLEQIDTALANIQTELLTVGMMAQKAQEGLDAAQKAYQKVEVGKMQATLGFSSGSAKLAAAESALSQSEAQLETATEQFNTAREQALKKADLSTLLTKDMVSNLILAQNFSMPAGYLYKDDEACLLKVGEGIKDMDQLQNTLLMQMDGVGDIRLGDVARITLIDTEGESYAKVNGSPAVSVSIQKGSTASTSAVSKAVNAEFRELEEKYPGLHITPLMDQGDYIKMTVNTVLSNLGWGAILAILVLALFLKDIRPTAVVALSIPVSLLFSVVLMYFSGVTLNIISLSGLALGVGMLVDNSIVVMENIYRLRSEGMSAARAAVKGAEQVAGAIAASTFTTVCVFLPIVFTSGMTRQLFMDMGLTIAYSLFASLLVALTVVPALGSTLMRTVREPSHPLFEKLVDLYTRALHFCLRFKVVPLGLAAVLLVMCIGHTAKMGLEFMPSMGGNQMSATLVLPKDISREEAFALADTAMEDIGSIEGIQTVGAVDSSAMMSQSSGDKVESMNFYLLLDEESAKDNHAVAEKVRALQQDLPGCELKVMTSNADMSMLGGKGIELVIRGRDLDRLNQISLDMIDLLDQVEGLEPATNGQEEGTEQLRLVVDTDEAMRHGLTVAQIYNELSAALKTDQLSTSLSFENGDFEVNVVDKRGALNRDNLLDYTFETTVSGPNGNTTESHKLGEFASLRADLPIDTIHRENQQRYITVNADTSEGYNTALVSREVRTLLNEHPLPDGFTVEIAGETQTIADSMTDLVKMLLLAISFIYLIMVAQFQSLLSPFIVMFTMPLAFTGGLGALWITGEPLSVIAMLGFLVLAGIVVNNGIVFVDYTNQLRLSGYDRKEALILAGKARIRPILMTALTTILAMSVMVFSKGMGAEMSRPMALVTIGGLAYATLLTLFIVPVLYDLLFRREPHKADVEDA